MSRVMLLTQELLPRYLDALITALLGLLQGGQKLVQEGALTAMASVADCAKDNFIKFYDQVRTRAVQRMLVTGNVPTQGKESWVCSTCMSL